MLPDKDDRDAASDRHGFVRARWFDMLRTHCFEDAGSLTAHAEIGGRRAWLPLVQEGDGVEALSNYYSFEYGPVFAGVEDDTQEFALMTRIAADLRRDWHRVGLYPLVDRTMAELLRRAFRRAGWIALLTERGTNYRLDVGGRDFESYWRARPGQLRETVRRKGRADRYAFMIHDNVTDALWSDYARVYAASWKNAEPWPQMIRAIAEEAAARGALRLGFAREGGTAVATQLWTIEGDTACIHKLAHDGAHDAGSPGTLLAHHMFAHMIDREGVAHIDYGTGGNAYKRDWMDVERPMLRLDCFDSRRARLWLPALRTRISQLVGR